MQTARFSSILLSLFPLQIKTGQLLRSGLDDMAVKSAGAAERPPLPRTWLPIGPQTASSASCAEVSCWSLLVSSLLKLLSSCFAPSQTNLKRNFFLSLDLLVGYSCNLDNYFPNFKNKLQSASAYSFSCSLLHIAQLNLFVLIC